MSITPLEQQIIELAAHELNTMQHCAETASNAPDAEQEVLCTGQNSTLLREINRLEVN
ncbi:hypothetical protein [Spartinivicinus poritis]|uniref:Uncharacterized protein n=1 Tax=Spartinivicinus poritis TaxID=2994640 RepID=A0ABT5UIP4_9GAMM|nr:hypothetical protein [Spartinivicinus sp. A2-2]MDE1465856.1 hypothetical protein [Spartinivicinus sp. A2-2]